MADEMDERRETDENDPDYESRSAYVRHALQARFNAEDAGEWETPEIEEPGASRAVPDGGDDADA